MKRTPLKRGNKGLKKIGSLKSGVRIKKAGKKTLEWSKVREDLNKESTITRCELEYPGCDNLHLAWAHAVKRRFLSASAEIGAPEHIRTCIRACQKCHLQIERMPKEQMMAIVMETIAKRDS